MSDAPISGPRATPTVCVYIQTYQHAPYIRDAIEGVLRQEGPFELELVIADDCSSDGTREILAEYRDRHPERIRLFLPERNLGPSEIFRRSVGELRGDYVAWLDGDDYWTDEQKLTKQVAALRRHPEWPACFHNATIVQADGNLPERPYVLELGRESVSFAELLRSNHIPSLSVMARGDLVRSLPGWVWDSLWGDWRAVLAFALHGEIGYLPETMGVYRAHPGGISSGLSRSEQLEEDLSFFTGIREIVPERYLPALDPIFRERHCQLVVERLEVPFSGAVVVLGARGEAPTELNGRQVWPLAIEEEELALLDNRDRDGSLARRLERFRLAAADAAPGRGHFKEGERVPNADGDPALRLLVVGRMLDWLDNRSRLGRQLEGHCETLWEDDVCSVREIADATDAPLPLGARAEVTAVKQASRGTALFGSHLDLPPPGAGGDSHFVEFGGWAIGERARPLAVELRQDERVIDRLPIDRPRPDLGSAFPDRREIGAAGFHGAISLTGREGGTIEVRATLENGESAPIAEVDWCRTWRSAGDPRDAQLVSVIVSDARSGPLEETVGSVRAQTYANLQLVLDPQADSGTGELLVFLAAGERLTARALETGVAALGQSRDAAFARGTWRRIDSEGRALGEVESGPRLACCIFRRAALEDGMFPLEEIPEHLAAQKHEGEVAELRLGQSDPHRRPGA